MRKDGLLSRLRSLQKQLPRGLREFRIVHRLNVQRRDAGQRTQFLGERRVIAMRIVQVLKAELRRAHHERKTAQAVALHAHFNHLLRLVVYGVQYQSANPLVVFRFAQRGVRAEVIAPKPEPPRIQIRPRGQEIDRRAHFVRFAIAKSADSRVSSSPRLDSYPWHRIIVGAPRNPGKNHPSRFPSPPGTSNSSTSGRPGKLAMLISLLVRWGFTMR